MVTLNPLDWSNLPSEAAMIPFPKEEVTPPVIKMYFVCEAIRSGGGVEISWILMGYKGREFSWIARKKAFVIFKEKIQIVWFWIRVSNSGKPQKKK